MKIGIITIQKCNNYGADLQAYALGAKLRTMDYDAENIDYLFYKHPRHQGGKLERPALPISMKNRIKEFLFPIIATFKGVRNRSVTIERRRRFDEWFNANIRVGREYRSVKSLYDDPPKYDVYVVGSDQVWNPRLYSNIKPYFFDFVPMGARCVSYASSFGVDELSGPVFYLYKQWLKKFSHIGLREKSGERIVKAMALDAEVAHVLDPTLLLDAKEWAAVSVEPNDKPVGKYLLLYDLIASEETVALAERWARQNELGLVRIGDGGYGPGEFIWLFAHAEAVVTNSFHGTVFSVLHHKPFYSVIPNGMGNSGRIESLLMKLGLMDRMVEAACVAGFVQKGMEDWSRVDSKVVEMRNASIEFLERAVAGGATKQSRKLPLGCYAIWNSDVDIRAASTSGGAFSILGEDVLSRGGLVYGAAWDADFRHVRHYGIDNAADLLQLRQSKYVYSDATDAIKEAKAALANGREVLFSGTPCQCAAMKIAAKGIDEKLTLVDFVCHGTPRPEVWESYAKELEDKYGSKLTKYEFRNKDKGWNFQNVVYAFANGRQRRVLPWLDPYFHGFSVNVFLRACCYTCPYATIERVSDFTIADCWRVAASNPEYDDNKGTSLVLVNTGRANAIWDRVLGSGHINGGTYDINLAQARNMALMHPPSRPRCHDNFKARFKETGSFSEAAKCYLSWKRDAKYAAIYWIKRLGWFYFKHHQ